MLELMAELLRYRDGLVDLESDQPNARMIFADSGCNNDYDIRGNRRRA